MRSAWILTTLLIAAGFATPAAAEAKTFLSDGTGDTSANVFGSQELGVPVQNPQFNAADLVSLDLKESEEALTFTLAVVDFKANTDFNGYEVNFDFRNMTYTAQIGRQVLPTGDSYVGGYLLATPNEEGNDTEDFCAYGCYVAELKVQLDAEKGTIGFDVPKAYVLDGLKRMPNRGDVLGNVHVVASSYITAFQGGVTVNDRMPDSEGQSYAIALGDVSSGHIVLSSQDRVRVSNGGASTFVYKVTLRNMAESEDTVDLALRDMPEGWNGTVQTPIKIPGSAEKTFTVLASVPFAHDHGGYDAFNLTAVSQSDPTAISTVRLGILHTPIPQPAGHHPELYLHPEAVRGGLLGEILPYTPGVINTDKPKDDELDKEISLCCSNNNVRFFEVDLNPALQMGLDFDVGKTGTLTGSILGHTVGTAQVSAKLYLYKSDHSSKPLLLAKSNAQDIALDLSNPSAFTLQITPTPESDYIAYAPKQNLALQIYLDSSDASMPCCLTFGGTGDPTLLVDGFKLVLPLNEYADRLTGISEAASAIELKANGPVEKAGRPGSLITYSFTLKNTGFSEDTFVVDTAGNDADRGSLVPGGDIKLAPKESREITLGVQIPSDLKDGQALEVLLFAHAKSDPSKMALARTKTAVATTGNATGDESKIFLQKKDEANKTPGFELVVVALGVAAAALLVRRRR